MEDSKVVTLPTRDTDVRFKASDKAKLDEMYSAFSEARAAQAERASKSAPATDQGTGDQQ